MLVLVIIGRQWPIYAALSLLAVGGQLSQNLVAIVVLSTYHFINNSNEYIPIHITLQPNLPVPTHNPLILHFSI